MRAPEKQCRELSRLLLRASRRATRSFPLFRESSRIATSVTMSSPHVAAAPTPALAHQHPGARLINVIVDPPTAFRGISDESPWALAFLAVVVVRIASLFAFYHPDVTPLKLIASVLFQVGTIVPVLLVSAGILWVTARVCGVALRSGTAFSIATHTYFAYTLATVAIASVAGALLPESADVELRSPPFTNLTPLAAGLAHPLVLRMAAEADVRSLYVLWLVWLGVRGAAPAERRGRISSVLGTIVAVRIVGVVATSLLR